MQKRHVQVVARIVAKRDKVEPLGALLRGLVAPTRKEPGCVTYELLQNSADASDFTFVEEWKTDADIDAHMGTPHVRQSLSALEELLAAPPDIHRYRLIE